MWLALGEKPSAAYTAAPSPLGAVNMKEQRKVCLIFGYYSCDAT
jgi:hypothetical protein